MDRRTDLDEQDGGQHPHLNPLGGVARGDTGEPLLDHLDGLGRLDQRGADLPEHCGDLGRVVRVWGR